MRRCATHVAPGTGLLVRSRIGGQVCRLPISGASKRCACPTTIRPAVSDGMAKEFFITTAIDYTNSAPHIGHAYEKVLADVIARYHRLKGEKVFFLTGVDQ